MSRSKPIIVINYKAYHPHSFGEYARRLAVSAIKVREETGVEIVLAPPFVEITNVKKVVEGTGINVYAQHADPVEPGAVTGFTPLEGLKSAGVDGVILNHSEHRLKLSDIYLLISKAKKLNLKTLVCADEPLTAAAVSVLSPDMVAIEPPELIGTGIPVSKAKPEVVTSSVEAVRRVNPSVAVLTGAGISTGEDVYLAIKLGTIGVLAASAIVKASDPYTVIKDMAEKALKALG